MNIVPLFVASGLLIPLFLLLKTEYGAPEDDELKTQQPFMLKNQLLSKNPFTQLLSTGS